MTKTKHVDAFGTELCIGDEVTYVYLDYSTLTFCRAQVIGETTKKIRIVITEYRSNGEVDQNINLGDKPYQEDRFVRAVGTEKLTSPWLLVKDRTDS